MGDEYAYSECAAGVCSDQWEAYLVKFDAIGGIDREATYRNQKGGDWAAEDIDLTSDGGAIVAIDDSTFGFLKLEPFLDPGDPSDPADLNDDGGVDAADVGLLLVAWNAPAGDINGDGTTDAVDLELLVAAWSPCKG